ncbi:MAG: hypothetical protein ACLPY1_06925 [Terracidiphilus sp.]
MSTNSEEVSKGIAAIRWLARGLGLLIAGFFLFMFIGETWEGHLRNPAASAFAHITPIATIGLALMGLYIIAMLLALKWEHAGTLIAVLALGAFFIILFMGSFPGNVSGGFSLRGVLNPILLFSWLPVLLYLLCWGLEGKRSRELMSQPR